jgi:hypothetical protein
LPLHGFHVVGCSIDSAPGRRHGLASARRMQPIARTTVEAMAWSPTLC